MPTLVPGVVEYVEIASVPLATYAWRFDVTPLWNEAEVRGADTLLPTVAGVVANPRRRTVTPVVLTGMFWGDTDSNGNPASNLREQLRLNVDEFHSSVVAPPGGDGTRPAVLHLAGGGSRTGAVHVLGGLELVPDGPTALRAVLRLSIPAGRLI